MRTKEMIGWIAPQTIGDFFGIERWSDNCFPMRDFDGFWGNASDHNTNNLSFGWRRIRGVVFELEDFPQN
jgi:hypothetical protein